MQIHHNTPQRGVKDNPPLLRGTDVIKFQTADCTNMYDIYYIARHLSHVSHYNVVNRNLIYQPCHAYQVVDT